MEYAVLTRTPLRYRRVCCQKSHHPPRHSCVNTELCSRILLQMKTQRLDFSDPTPCWHPSFNTQPSFSSLLLWIKIYIEEGKKKKPNPCHLARTFLCKYSWYDLYQQQILKYFSSLLQSSWQSQLNQLRGSLWILPRKSLLPKKPSRKAAHPCKDRQSQLSL